jgi:hypothetical protein
MTFRATFFSDIEFFLFALRCTWMGRTVLFCISVQIPACRSFVI